jgi:hypothetical protein
MQIILIYDQIRLIKKEAFPLQAWRGFQEVEVPRFHDNGTGW